MKSCDVCAFFAEHGHYPPGIRWHCDDGCHASGYGASELHCSGMGGSGCHRTFGSETAFTAHQGESGCRDPLDLKTRDGKRRFKAIERSGKMVWVRADAPASRATVERLGTRVKKSGRAPRSVACEGRCVHGSDRLVVAL